MLCHIDAIKNYLSAYLNSSLGYRQQSSPPVSNSRYPDVPRTFRVIKTKRNGSFPLRNIQAVRKTGQMKTAAPSSCRGDNRASGARRALWKGLPGGGTPAGEGGDLMTRPKCMHTFASFTEIRGGIGSSLLMTHLFYPFISIKWQELRRLSWCFFSLEEPEIIFLPLETVP